MPSTATFSSWRSDGPRLFSDRLIVRPIARADEDYFGYKLRLAHLNGLAKPSWIKARSPSAAMPKGLARSRWCPRCLSEEDGYWLESWASGDGVCLRHQCWLADSCPSCVQATTWNRLRFTMCGCGQTLAAVPVTPLSPAIMRFLTSSALDESGRWLEPLTAEQRWRIARFIGALEAFGLHGKPQKKASSTSIDIERRVVTLGASILEGGDSALFALLDRIRIPPVTGNRVQLISDAFPRLLTMIRRQLGDDERDWVVGMITSYVDTTMDTQTAVIWERKSLECCQRRGEVFPKRKPRARRMVAMLSSVGIIPKIRKTRSGRQKVAVGDVELNDLKTRLEDVLPLKTAARRFGLSVGRLRALMQAGVIEETRNRAYASSINLLFQRLAMRALPRSLDEGLDVIPLMEALRRHVPVSMTNSFIDALVDGQITVVSRCEHPSHLNVLSVDRSQLQRYMARAKTASMETLSIPDAAQRFGVKQEVMYHLVNIGLIRTVIDRTGRRPVRKIERSELERFSADVEPLVRAASRAGVSPKGALRWAQSLEIPCISGPSIDGGRQYFVRQRAVSGERSQPAEPLVS